MSNVKMPEPDTHCLDTDTGLDVWSYSKAQMRQYGDDRAREALEMAQTKHLNKLGKAND